MRYSLLQEHAEKAFEGAMQMTKRTTHEDDLELVMHKRVSHLR